MKKITTFFAMATIVVALSSCGSKSAENATEATDSVAAETMEAAPAVADSAATMVTDTTAH